ncbi:MAG TPA: alpha/beta hydrolase [Rhizomicrobium sp.]
MRILIGIVITLVVLIAVLGGMIVFGTSAAPPPMASISNPFTKVDFSGLPNVTRFKARDGASLAVRVWSAGAAADVGRVVILIHGSSASGASMHPLAQALRDAGAAVYAPDMRGHGASGRRSDIDYAAQLDDDLADLVAAVQAAHPAAKLTLLGFSSGGGFALHSAATPLGSAFARTVLVSPMLGPRAPTARGGFSNAWAQPFLPRIIALVILDRAGIHAFDYLPSLAFGIAPENAERLTGVYSFRLMMAFGTRDYATDLKNARAPLSVLVGSEDELFDAAKFAPTVHAERPEVPVAVVSGLGHIAMTADARAISAIVAATR